MAVDCQLATDRLVREPVFVWKVDAELPPELAESMKALSTDLQPTRGDTTQWNPRPFWRSPVIELHRIIDWKASRD